MHPTALTNCGHFFDTYVQDHSAILEIGSQNVNGGLRELANHTHTYTGVDFVAGNGVDLILDDPYTLPFVNNTFDYVLSSSCFEHSEFFWLVFLEIQRVLKPGGLFYLNVPSNGNYHRYPVDCWRFYPDSGQALVNWAKRISYNTCLLESYTSVQSGDIWNDYVAVFLKDDGYICDYPLRILDTKSDITNGFVYGSDTIINHSPVPQDRRL